MGEWWRVIITANPGIVDAIAAIVVDSTGQGVEEPRSGVIRTIVDTQSRAESLVSMVRRQFAGIDVVIEPAAAVDWSTRWREGIVTRTFGRLVLTPSWLPAPLRRDQVVVTIDPESAFGSGEHGSTRGALALLERWLGTGDRMLDLGSGSGILAIAAVKLGARSAIGIDVDPESLPVAEANARRNCVDHAVRFLVGDAAQLAPLAGPAEVICSNILRSVNSILLPAILAALAPGGTLVFAGMELDEAPLFLPVLAQHRLAVVDEARDAGWWSVAVRTP